MTTFILIKQISIRSKVVSVLNYHAIKTCPLLN